jgi:mxaK protein
MGLKSRLGLLCALVALGAATGLGLEVSRARAIDAYNLAVTQERHAEAAVYPGDVGRFAAAYAAQIAGQHQDARLIYSGLERSEGRSLRVAALYNTGNTYLEQAAAVDMKTDADRAVPLIELAKRSYRDALALDPAHWDARYNLERALQLLPDAYDKKVIEVEGRQSPVRTVIGGDAESPWP